jgi:hypothetical protein
MQWRKLFDVIELSWSSIWANAGFDLHFLPPEVVEVCLVIQEKDNGN